MVISLINGYKIKEENGKIKVYIYLDFNYEFSIFKKSSRKKLIDEIKNFLIKNNIVIAGTSIILVASGNIIGNINIKESNLLVPPVIETTSVIEKILEIPEIKENKEIEEIKGNKETKENEEVYKEIDNPKLKEEETKNEKTIKQNSVKIVNNDVNSKIDINKEEIKEKPKEIVEENIPKKEEVKEEIVDIEKEENVQQVDNSIYVFVNRKNEVVKLELEEYVVGVVAGEMPASFKEETLKAMSVLARTYALKSLKYNKKLTDDVRTQTYKSIDEMKNMWKDDFNKYYNKIKSAVESTKGEYLSFEGDYIEAVYHSTSNGMTESSSEVWGYSYPYLVTVESPYDTINKSYEYTKDYTYEEISNILETKVDLDTVFEIISLTESGRIRELKINDKVYKGVDIRNLLSLRSADFEIIKQENNIKVITKGYGHGVGLSEYGAEGYARNGYNYKEILKHYYPNTELK